MDRSDEASGGGPADGESAPGRPHRNASHDAIYAALYGELRAIARRQMADQRRGHTLQPTDLAHEAIVKLFRSGSEWASRAHFLGTAARAMRHILVDHARSRKRVKRGAGMRRVPLDDVTVGFEDESFDVLVISDLIDKLATIDAEGARIAEMKIFADMTGDEIAKVLTKSTRTVERDWKAVRAWLWQWLRPE